LFQKGVTLTKLKRQQVREKMKLLFQLLLAQMLPQLLLVLEQKWQKDQTLRNWPVEMLLRAVERLGWRTILDQLYLQQRHFLAMTFLRE